MQDGGKILLDSMDMSDQTVISYYEGYEKLLDQEEKKPVNKQAIGFQIGSQFLFFAANYFVKQCFMDGFKPQDTMLVCGFWVTIVNLIIRLRDKYANPIPLKAKILLVIRGVTGALSTLCSTASLQYLPVSIAILMGNISPVFLVFLAYILIGEKATYM